MLRFLLFLLVLTLVSVSYAPGAPPDDTVVYPLVFPVAGEHRFSEDFGDPRSGGRSHEGIDIIAEKLTPVVAVADGTVRWMDAERGGDCCAVSVVHDDGWRSRYIHLNNDTPGTDDGDGYGIARGIRVGARVRAGQVIGFVGDSGNAEATVAHLHFELRRPDGSAVDAFGSLQAALADPSTSPAPRVAGPPVRAPRDLSRGVRRPERAPEVAERLSTEGGEETEEIGEGAAGEDGEERAGDGGTPAMPVTPFLPVPGDDCSGEMGAEIALAEVRGAARPGLACFDFRGTGADGG